MTTKFEVFSLINDTHSSTADLADDAVMGDHLPHGLCGRGHWFEILGVSGGEVNGLSARLMSGGTVFRSSVPIRGGSLQTTFELLPAFPNPPQMPIGKTENLGRLKPCDFPRHCSQQYFLN